MGLIQGCLKVVGTVALTTTGVASKVLSETSNVMGFDLGCELFEATKEASFNGIRNMWDSGSVSNTFDSVEKSVDTFDGRKKMAETAKRAADMAKKKGNIELYEKYFYMYYEYKD